MSGYLASCAAVAHSGRFGLPCDFTAQLISPPSGRPALRSAVLVVLEVLGVLVRLLGGELGHRGFRVESQNALHCGLSFGQAAELGVTRRQEQQRVDRRLGHPFDRINDGIVVARRVIHLATAPKIPVRVERVEPHRVSQQFDRLLHPARISQVRRALGFDVRIVRVERAGLGVLGNTAIQLAHGCVHVAKQQMNVKLLFHPVLKPSAHSRGPAAKSRRDRSSSLPNRRASRTIPSPAYANAKSGSFSIALR